MSKPEEPVKHIKHIIIYVIGVPEERREPKEHFMH